MRRMRIIILIIAFSLFSLFGSNLANTQSPVTTVVENIGECDYRWFCSDWYPTDCPENQIQTRKCTNAGDCPDTYQKPEEKQSCTLELPKQLFDIKLELAYSEYSEVYSPKDLTAWIRFESFGTEPTPINLTYIILDEQENIVYVKEDHLVVETEEFVVERFEGVDLKPGKYSLLLKTLYNTDIEDEFIQNFEVKSEMRIWIYIITGFVILGVVYLIVLMKKKKGKTQERKIRDLERELKRHKTRKKERGKKK